MSVLPFKTVQVVVQDNILSTIKDIYLFGSCWNLLDIQMRLQSLQSWREVQLFDILPENVGCSALG